MLPKPMVAFVDERKTKYVEFLDLVGKKYDVIFTTIRPNSTGVSLDAEQNDGRS